MTLLTYQIFNKLISPLTVVGKEPNQDQIFNELINPLKVAGKEADREIPVESSMG